MGLSLEKAEYLRGLIADGQIEKALSSASESSWVDKDAFRLIRAGWNEIKRQEQTGTIRIDDLQIERNKLINRLLDQIAQEVKSPSGNRTSSFSINRFWILGFLMLAVGIVLVLFLLGGQSSAFPEVFSGYLLETDSGLPITDANLELINGEGQTISLRSFSTDDNGKWVMRTSEQADKKCRISIRSEACGTVDVYLETMQKSEESSAELDVYIISMNCKK